MAEIHMWVAEPPSAEVRKALARLAETNGVAAVAVMPDVHLASDVCIGTVVATRELIFPAAVGGDIGCGMAAIAFEGDAAMLRDRYAAAQVLGGLQRAIPVIKHPHRQALPASLTSEPLSDPALCKLREREGAVELGTVGRGNHFVELQADEDDRLWAMVHSGSRGMGQAIRDHHLRACFDTNTGLRALHADSDAGRAYLGDMAWALAFAEENRRRLVEAVATVVSDALDLRACAETFIGCHHNHVEQREGLWIHRKGAIAADAGKPGIIPGSMGTASFHVSGRGVAAALWSSSHGAGRVMSRTEARRRITRKRLSEELEGVWYDHRMTPRLVDEAPSAYKDIGKVMRAQSELTSIVRRLRPLLSFKGA